MQNSTDWIVCADGWKRKEKRKGRVVKRFVVCRRKDGIEPAKKLAGAFGLDWPIIGHVM